MAGRLLGALVLDDHERQASTGPYLLGVLLASGSWQLLLAGGGAALGRVLTSQRGQLITAVISSLLIVALAIPLLGHATERLELIG